MKKAILLLITAGLMSFTLPTKKTINERFLVYGYYTGGVKRLAFCASDTIEARQKFLTQTNQPLSYYLYLKTVKVFNTCE